MDIILIACCKLKQEGGISDYVPSRQLEKAPSPESLEKLLNARAELVRNAQKKLPTGPDLGIPNTKGKNLYLPAYQRYSGIVYQRGRVRDLYPNQSHVTLVIISALYGVLDGHDLIQNYDLTMDDKISDKCANTWWKRHGLGKIVEEYIQFYNPRIVHDLLPIKYRKALSPWPPPSLRDRVKPYNYPGADQGSSYRRGEDLKRLLLPESRSKSSPAN